MNKMFKITILLGLVLGLFVTVSPVYGEGKDNGDGDKKITICHVPDGNPENAQTITISKKAWKDSCQGEGCHCSGCHGGDYLGACVEEPEEPVDCILTDWSSCSSNCYGGTQTRTILVEPSNGGEQCGELTRPCGLEPCNCSGHWGECSALSGEGISIFIIDNIGNECGEPCPYAEGAEQPCIGGCPVAEECPSKCGYQGGDIVSDGQCGKETCSSTEPCPKNKPPENSPQFLPVTGDGEGSTSEKALILVGVSLGSSMVAIGLISLIDRLKRVIK